MSVDTHGLPCYTGIAFRQRNYASSLTILNAPAEARRAFGTYGGAQC